MNYRKRYLIAFSVISLVAVSTSAQADGFYFGADYGRIKIDETLDADGFQFSLDDSASAYRVFAGYDITGKIAVEAGYNDFGSVNTLLPGLTVRAEAEGQELAAVFRWPLTERFSLKARIGNLWWDSDVQVAGILDADSGSDSFAGFGVEFAASDRTAISFGWRRYQLDDLDLDQFSAGLLWHFGD